MKGRVLMSLSRRLKLTALFLFAGLITGCVSTSSNVINPSERGVKTPSSFVVEYNDMEFVLVPEGAFDMGSPEDEAGRDNDETPVHKVTLPSFYIGKYETTQAQWEKVMGGNPSTFKGTADLPVEEVSWEDVHKFIKRLNRKTGLKLRLPTEAEWEYACRAGSQTRFYSGNDEKLLGEYAWFNHNAGGETHLVGTRRPNAFGLYDMHGNVSEWIGDGRRGYLSSQESSPVGPPVSKNAIHRGGAWLYPGKLCRSANRMASEKDFKTHIIGFRLAIDKDAIDFNDRIK
jgi:formylglycine-generating enzyme required for sulfatase activity